MKTTRIPKPIPQEHENEMKYENINIDELLEEQEIKEGKKKSY